MGGRNQRPRRDGRYPSERGDEGHPDAQRMEVEPSSAVPQPTWRDLGKALQPLLEGLGARLGSKNKLAQELGLDHSAIHHWLDGTRRPGFGSMYSLLDLNAAHHVLADGAIAEVFRLWLVAWKFPPSAIDAITGKVERDRLARVVAEKDKSLRAALAERDLHRRDFAWSRLMRELESARRELVRDPGLRHGRVEGFISHVLLRVCQFYCTHYENTDWVKRAAIYTPTRLDGNLLAIKWQRGLLQDSVRYNCWYCGPGDPPAGRFVGFVGDVYRKGVGEAIPNVLEDVRFKDLHQPNREPRDIGYRSAIKVPLATRDTKSKLGVLSFDSMHHLFDAYDLLLVSEVAQLLAGLIEETGVPHEVDYLPPEDYSFETE